MSGCKLVPFMMKFLMSRMMLSCIAATELVEKGIYFRLNPVEYFKLRLHNRMCGACHHYMVQSKWLHKLLIKIISEGHSSLHNHTNMPQELKPEIISKINAQ
jgi:hypothetical protein